MSSLKASIPTKEVLKKRLDDAFAVGLTDFIARTSERRIIVLKNHRYLISSVLVFVISVLVLFLAYSLVSERLMQLITMYLLGIVVATIIFANRWYREQKLLTQELNLALVPIVTACFDRLCLYTHDDVHRKETEAIVKASDLLVEHIDVLTADDMFSFFDPYELTVREIQATRQVNTGKSSTTVRIFHGVVVEATLPKTLEGATIISTEGDKGSFSHRDFWRSLVGKGGVEETVLEWNEFENDLHVATNNPVEARYILTPNFMVDLHTWWAEHKTNIRISFTGNKFFMLLPDTQVRIGTSTTSTDSDDLKAYAQAVIEPLWRTLLLIEDIKI